MDVSEAASLTKSGRERRGWSAADLARRVVELAQHQGEDYSLTQQAVSHFEGGKSKSIPRWVSWAKIILLSETRDDIFKSLLAPEHVELLDLLHGATEEKISKAWQILQNSTPSEAPDLVEIAMVDMAYGMGATFADDRIGVDLVHFPKIWVDQLTHSAPASLAWARGKGDSMAPTINDGDMVLIDRSERRVEDQDLIWAFTIGDMAMIKRLRIRGDKVTILSDNSEVPADAAHPDEINIIGRITRVVKPV